LGRYLVIWRSNLAAWPKDPAEGLKLLEQSYAAIEELMKKGVVKDYGDFVDGMSGYITCEGEPADIFRGLGLEGQPFWTSEVHEVVPYEKAKGAWRDVFKARIEAGK